MYSTTQMNPLNNFLQPIMEDPCDSIHSTSSKKPAIATASAAGHKRTLQANNSILAVTASMASKMKKKTSLQQAQGTGLLRFCTVCGWRYKTTTDRFCGECGTARKEK
jgi:hypothetical protein